MCICSWHAAGSDPSIIELINHVNRGWIITLGGIYYNILKIIISIILYKSSISGKGFVNYVIFVYSMIQFYFNIRHCWTVYTGKE